MTKPYFYSETYGALQQFYPANLNQFYSILQNMTQQSSSQSQSSHHLKSIISRSKVWQTTFMGVQRFINIRDLTFFIENRNSEQLKHHHKYLEQLYQKTIFSFSLFPLAIFGNTLLQKKFAHSLGGFTLRGAVFDLLWFTATSYLFVIINEMHCRDKQFISAKQLLIQKHSKNYFTMIKENVHSFRIPLVEQVKAGQKSLTAAQLFLIQQKLKQIMNEDSKGRKS